MTKRRPVDEHVILDSHNYRLQPAGGTPLPETTHYQPARLNLALASLILLALAITWLRDWSLRLLIDDLIAVLLVAMAAIKLRRLEAFAAEWRWRDPLARRLVVWAYLLPFAEIFLGFAFLLTYRSLILNLAGLMLATLLLAGSRSGGERRRSQPYLGVPLERLAAIEGAILSAAIIGLFII